MGVVVICGWLARGSFSILGLFCWFGKWQAPRFRVQLFSVCTFFSVYSLSVYNWNVTRYLLFLFRTYEYTSVFVLEDRVITMFVLVFCLSCCYGVSVRVLCFLCVPLSSTNVYVCVLFYPFS